MSFDPVVQARGGAPDQFRLGGVGRDKVSVESPMMILAQGDPIRRVIVAAFGEGDEVAGIDDGEVAQSEADAGGGAAVVVNLFDCFGEGGGADGIVGRLRGVFGRFFDLMKCADETA